MPLQHSRNSRRKRRERQAQQRLQQVQTLEHSISSSETESLIEWATTHFPCLAKQLMTACSHFIPTLTSEEIDRQQREAHAMKYL